jgi:nucleotide-binding universal stress UspA family protein
MYNNILVPVVLHDGPDVQACYHVAQALAAKDAKFTVMYVMEEIPPYVEFEIPEETLQSTRSAAEKALAQAAAALPGASTKLITGHPGRDILDYAENNDIDCIVMASHRPGFSDFFLGSTAARVVRHAPCAVHVIR